MLLPLGVHSRGNAIRHCLCFYKLNSFLILWIEYGAAIVLSMSSLGVELQGNYRGMSSRYAAKAAYRCENPSAAAGALASNWILRRWRCLGNASLLRKEGLTKTGFRRSSSLYENNHAARGYLLFFQFLAVRGGFEPPEPLRVRQFSKLLVSATHPSHRVVLALVVTFY